jgi:hypothetical protein
MGETGESDLSVARRQETPARSQPGCFAATLPMGQAAVKSSIVEAVAAVTGGAETLDLKGARAPAGASVQGGALPHTCRRMAGRGISDGGITTLSAALQASTVITTLYLNSGLLGAACVVVVCVGRAAAGSPGCGVWRRKRPRDACVCSRRHCVRSRAAAAAAAAAAWMSGVCACSRRGVALSHAPRACDRLMCANVRRRRPPVCPRAQRTRSGMAAQLPSAARSS